MLSRTLSSCAIQLFMALAFAGSFIPAAGSAQQTPSTPSDDHAHFEVPAEVENLLSEYCAACHGALEQQAGLRMDALGELDESSRLSALQRIEEQLHLQAMPPEGESKPGDADLVRLSNWVSAQVRLAGGASLKDKLRYPQYGNYVDHNLLFDGEIEGPAYTPARRWLVSPQVFHERVMDVFRLTGRERQNYMTRSFHGVTNPFVLPEQSGVRDYDYRSLNGGHLLVMLNNAQWIAGKQIFAARLEVEDKDRLINGLSRSDRWYPKQTPEPFRVIVVGETVPSREQMVAAIQEQFDRALRRPATAGEVQRYLELLTASVSQGGNIQGLQRMLVAVLLESEFLYRLEFGGGSPDEFGRRMLAPQEAAFAISYALGDRGPDETLMRAAKEGALQTREDYEREVRRLLDDEEYYRGQIDSSINGKHYQSNVTSHPRIIRFFREFFGYTAASKVFKDSVRIGGIYQNPGRGTLGTPGWLIYEADRIVTWHVEQDQQVFENLLTSDQFFVYHNMDNETGQATIEQWRTIYEQLKESNWKAEPQVILEQQLEFIAAQAPTLRITKADQVDEFTRWMYYFEESFGRGRTPFTRPPWGHGYTYHHAPYYSLPGTPSIGRYHLTIRDNFDGFDDSPLFWDYPTQQPFQIENRRGILTHPAWLIAHSTNFHSDPIRRGRWIREKLLAGNVPDIPITVDAQVPEDPKLTLRDRVEQVTLAQSCWRCHQQMNPLGMPFETFDDFGRYRTDEELEHPDNLISQGNTHGILPVYPTLPVDSSGELIGTGESTLDGDVTDALDLIDRLANSSRVRQSIIRHAFRFYMGRNEMLSDAQTLIDADQAYLESNGSFKAVIVSLLTSDSFMYRKELED